MKNAPLLDDKEIEKSLKEPNIVPEARNIGSLTAIPIMTLTFCRRFNKIAETIDKIVVRGDF